MALSACGAVTPGVTGGEPRLPGGRPPRAQASRREAGGVLAHRHGEATRARGAPRTHTEARIKGLVGFLADGDRSAYVVESLRDLEAQALTEKQAIASLRAQAGEPIPLPRPDEFFERVFDLDARLGEEALWGREALRRLFHAGELRLVPQDDGVDLARAPPARAVPTTPKSGRSDPRKFGSRILPAVVAGAGFAGCIRKSGGRWRCGSPGSSRRCLRRRCSASRAEANSHCHPDRRPRRVYDRP